MLYKQSVVIELNVTRQNWFITIAKMTGYVRFRYPFIQTGAVHRN